MAGVMKATTYDYIRVWGHLMGSFAYYVRDEQTRAAEDGAPSSAIYHTWVNAAGHACSQFDPDARRVWRTADEIAPFRRWSFERACEQCKVPAPRWES